MLFCGRSLKLTSTGRVLGFRGQERIRKSNSRDWLDHTCGAERLEPAYGNEAAAALLPPRHGPRPGRRLRKPDYLLPSFINLYIC